MKRFVLPLLLAAVAMLAAPAQAKPKRNPRMGGALPMAGALQSQLRKRQPPKRRLLLRLPLLKKLRLLQLMLPPLKTK
jgi:hypothetical protein